MRSKRGWGPVFALATTLLSWSLMTLLFLIFYAACFNGNQQVTIDVDKYGEMKVEAILFGFIWILTTANVVLVWKRADRES